MLAGDIRGRENDNVLCFTCKPVVCVSFMYRHPIIDFTKLAQKVAIHVTHSLIGPCDALK